MAIQSFFKQRKPRQFEHKPIYWDARKEELNKRVERIRAELIASGELAPDTEVGESIEPTQTQSVDEDMRERVRGALLSGAEHLQKQHDRGMTSYDRSQRMVRLVLMLLALGAISWFMYNGTLDFFI